jgi:hypothetical protein
MVTVPEMIVLNVHRLAFDNTEATSARAPQVTAIWPGELCRAVPKCSVPTASELGV